MGSLINTTADNLRGQGANIRDTVIKLSQAFSALGDKSTDIFSTVKNLSILVSALQDSTTLMRQLNQNLASVTGLLADNPNEVADAVRDLNDVVGDVQSFVADNREALGTTSDKLAGVTQALTDSLDDVKQFLHVAPNTLQNYVNIYQPAQGAASAVLAVNNFANPITFLCGAVQAASRLGAEQSAKLCVQYLAPIIKNRQYNFPPLGLNLFVGATARPNEITYSEDWMRPDYIPPQPPPPASPPPPLPAEGGPPPYAVPPDAPPLAAEAPMATNPADGLHGSDGAAGSRIMMRRRRIRLGAAAGLLVLATAVSGCGDWQGLNSIPLPGVEGRGPGAFTIQAQMPDVDNIEPNSRVRVGDVTVGNVTKIERQGWNALVTMELNGNVELPANATAKLGQTSLLGSLHIELAPPTDVAPRGQAARRFADPVVVGEASTRAPSRRWPRSRCCSTAVGSAMFRTSPRRSAPPGPAARPTCAA